MLFSFDETDLEIYTGPTSRTSLNRSSNRMPGMQVTPLWIQVQIYLAKHPMPPLDAAGLGILTPLTGGSSLTITGYALTVGTAADATSIGFKTVDAMAFGGSYDVAMNQFLKTTLSGGGRVIKKVAGRYDRFSETGGRFMIRATQARRAVPVSNQFGYSVTAARDATNVLLDVQIKFSRGEGK